MRAASSRKSSAFCATRINVQYLSAIKTSPHWRECNLCLFAFDGTSATRKANTSACNEEKGKTALFLMWADNAWSRFNRTNNVTLHLALISAAPLSANTRPSGRVNHFHSNANSSKCPLQQLRVCKQLSHDDMWASESCGHRFMYVCLYVDAIAVLLKSSAEKYLLIEVKVGNSKRSIAIRGLFWPGVCTTN